eukprot:11179574-Lingulodinium_polyedra.AAC.1
MHSEMHSIAAAPRTSRFAHSTRRPPRGGRRMERARRDIRNAAIAGRARTAQHCVQKCTSIGAAPRMSQFTHSI